MLYYNNSLYAITISIIVTMTDNKTGFFVAKFNREVSQNFSSFLTQSDCMARSLSYSDLGSFTDATTP